ncbi:SGNH/GDSL hydrolase family protein [Aquimarina sp. Aq78]|uniref:SGNH/GDSL hydrolase family protein n=1 Tax=Aquimarina sp. Aq78 TaxID=1191889 RepID=UPI000D0F2F43|nr:SGNH/GDSL hydrolase family protein [Aquimarina sp. Aq78]
MMINRAVVIFIGLFIVCISCSSTHVTQESEIESFDQQGDERDISNEKYSLLFVGNSLTYYNDLPKLVREEAKNKGIIVTTTMLAKPNYAIIDHWADREVQRLIKTKKYDFVIIQQGPSSQADGREMLLNSGKEYSDFCNANGAKLAYFMVWPSRIYYHTFEGVIKNYTDAAIKNNAILCPVGKIWKQHFDKTNDFSYYSPDQFHPSLSGSQVAARVIVASLFAN